ncbi:YciI family protein [Sphingomonas alpina]|uniref:YCII-related domain-containing protein n=1 Tax=Sphingomonas alpina TaxID=653931 RepID=A0A7H0LK93_9SPHN|nr:YciI family protein [Sphingomonas alpina]QNQ10096.1 hypothetical protein H3Z74_02260 [Sphingomonas alpina]
MPDFILLMHNDTAREPSAGMWDSYFTSLRQRGGFSGGSSIGSGETVRKDGPAGTVADHLVGYIRIEANDLADAKSRVAGNPVYECGGTVEVRSLPPGED